MSEKNTLDGFSDADFDHDFEYFMDGTESMFIDGKMVNPFMILHVHSKDNGRETSYIEIENPGNTDIWRVVKALEKAGADFARGGKLPFMSMIGSAGHAEHYTVDRIDDLRDLAQEVEEKMLSGEVQEDSVMTAAMVVDGRKRATVSFFVSPPDGGTMLDRRVILSDKEAFLVGEGVDIFDLCMAPFVGAASVIED